MEKENRFLKKNSLPINEITHEVTIQQSNTIQKKNDLFQAKSSENINPSSIRGLFMNEHISKDEYLQNLEKKRKMKEILENQIKDKQRQKELEKEKEKELNRKEEERIMREQDQLSGNPLKLKSKYQSSPIKKSEKNEIIQEIKTEKLIEITKENAINNIETKDIQKILIDNENLKAEDAKKQELINKLLSEINQEKSKEKYPLKEKQIPPIKAGKSFNLRKIENVRQKPPLSRQNPDKNKEIDNKIEAAREKKAMRLIEKKKKKEFANENENDRRKIKPKTTDNTYLRKENAIKAEDRTLNGLENRISNILLRPQRTSTSKNREIFETNNLSKFEETNSSPYLEEKRFPLNLEKNLANLRFSGPEMSASSIKGNNKIILPSLRNSTELKSHSEFMFPDLKTPHESVFHENLNFVESSIGVCDFLLTPNESRKLISPYSNEFDDFLQMKSISFPKTPSLDLKSEILVIDNEGKEQTTSTSILSYGKLKFPKEVFNNNIRKKIII